MNWILLLQGCVAACVLTAQTVGPAFFGAKVYPVMEAAQCRDCHSREGVASGTRLHFPEQDANADRIRYFGLSLARLVDRPAPEKSLLLNKPTNRLPHTGGQRIKPGSEGDVTLTAWVRYLATLDEATVAAAAQRLDAEGPAAPHDRPVRRLSHSQYNNTVRDLLGDRSKPANRFPPEDFVNGFRNQFSIQGMPPLLVESYSKSAEKLALNTFRAVDVNRLIPCSASARDEQCRERFVREFGERAFRRPLTDAEVRRYVALFASQAEVTGDFLEGARMVVEGMLQSPKFLLHLEEGPDCRFRDYAVASRLSYFLWDTMPDKALLHAAANGELARAGGIERIARRMLDDPRAVQAAGEFFTQWLRLDRVRSAVKDKSIYPEFTPAVAVMMTEETQRLLGDVVWNDRSFMEAFTAGYGFLNSELSTYYGLPAPAGEFQKVQFPAGSRRAGLLGQGSFLVAAAGPVETSPTSRGVFIREQFLCQQVPAPPPNVNTNLPEPDPRKPLTRRQRLTAHVEDSSCASCHRLMDPVGLGLEHFDAVGRWRERERIELRAAGKDAAGNTKKAQTVELAIDARGEVAGLPDSTFSDPVELGRILAASPVCQECVVRQLFRYAYGRKETAADEPRIAKLFQTFRESGFPFKTLLVGVVLAPQFLEGLP